RDFLTGDGEAVVVEEAERRKIGGGECPVGHVEVFRMASVGTSIIGRPRPRLRDRHAADSSGGRYTLKHDEPSIRVEGLGSGVTSTLAIYDSEFSGVDRVSVGDSPWISQSHLPADHWETDVTIAGTDRIGYTTGTRGRA